MKEHDDLPTGWIRATLGDYLAELRNGTTAKQNKEGIGTPVTRIETVQNGLFDENRLGYIADPTPKLEDFFYKSGDIAFSHINSMEKVGKVSIYVGRPPRLIHGMNLLRLRPDLSLIDAHFLYYQLQSSDTLDVVRGSVHMAVNQVSINQKNLSKLPINVAPLNEQAQIVNVIEEQFTRLDSGVAALKRVEANLKRYKAAVLKAAVEGRLTERWRGEHPDVEPASELLKRILKERRSKWEEEELAKLLAKGKPPNNDKWKEKYKEPEGPDTTQLPKLPKSWKWVTLLQCSWRLTDGTHQPPTFSEEGIPFIFVKHMVGGKILFTNTKHIDEKTYLELNSRCPVEFGDILYSAVGSYGVAVPVLTQQLFSFQRHIAHLKPVMPSLQLYLVNCLNSICCLVQAHRVARGVAQKTVTLGDLSKFAIPLAPFGEQEEVVEAVDQRLSISHVICQQVDAVSRRAKRLRQSILKRAFEGKLVEQDTSDEPASILLERIKAEREIEQAKTNSKPKRRKRVAAVTKSAGRKRSRAKADQPELF